MGADQPEAGSAAIESSAATPLLELADPDLVPLETLTGSRRREIPARRGAAVARAGGESVGKMTSDLQTG